MPSGHPPTLFPYFLAVKSIHFRPPTPDISIIFTFFIPELSFAHRSKLTLTQKHRFGHSFPKTRLMTKVYGEKIQSYPKTLEIRQKSNVFINFLNKFYQD